MSRLLAVAEEGLVVDPRLQALEVEPARGLVATIVIAIERHLVEARVVIGIPSMSGLPELVCSLDAQEAGLSPRQVTTFRSVPTRIYTSQ